MLASEDTWWMIPGIANEKSNHYTRSASPRSLSGEKGWKKKKRNTKERVRPVVSQARSFIGDVGSGLRMSVVSLDMLD